MIRLSRGTSESGGATGLSAASLTATSERRARVDEDRTSNMGHNNGHSDGI